MSNLSYISGSTKAGFQSFSPLGETGEGCIMVYKRRTVEPEMFYGAKPEIFEKARELRRNMTEAMKCNSGV